MRQAIAQWATGFRYWRRSGHLDLLTLLYLSVSFVAWFSVLCLVLAARAVDRWRFPDLKSQPIRKPIYILAAPRSGTTLLHRLVSLDDEQFVAPKLQETLFTSVTLQQGLNLLTAIDKALFSPVARFIGWFERQVFKRWDNIHTIGLNRYEEPEGLWVLSMSSPVIAPLFFPFRPLIKDWMRFDNLDPFHQHWSLDFYMDGMRQLVYQRGQHKTLLNKTVLAAGRLHHMRQRMPDMRAVALVRHPYEAIPSMMSMLGSPMRLRWTDPEMVKPAYEALYQMALFFYRTYADVPEHHAPEDCLLIRYDDLRADPKAAVLKIYERFGLSMSPAFEDRLDAEIAGMGGYKSSHSYNLEMFGLTKERLYEDLKPLFERFSFDP